MTTAITTQAPASAVSSGSSASRAEPALKAPESGDKSTPTVDEVPAAVVRISAEGAQRAEAADRQVVIQQQPGAAEPKASAAGGGAQGARPAGGQPPTGSAGTADVGSQAASSTSSTSSSQPYKPADTNQDGTVSPKEQQAYNDKLAADKAAAQAAVKAYQGVEQLGQDGGTAAT